MKKDEKEIARILDRNPAPRIKEEEKEKLRQEMWRGMDHMDILTFSTFPGRLLRQIPYITSWVWVVQAMVVIVFAVLLRQGRRTGDAAPVVAMLSAGPLLALLLVVDVARSYGCNMWEMEAACRYDLRRVTAMRMCIVGGVDLAVLAVCCSLYGRAGGSIWESGLFAVLPFLINSSVYLWELNRFSRRCSIYMLAVTGMGLNLFGSPVLYNGYLKISENGMEWVPAITLCSLGLACAVMGYYMARLYRHGLAREGEITGWSLE